MALTRIVRAISLCCVATLLLAGPLAHAGGLVIDVTVTADLNMHAINRWIDAEATLNYYYSGTDTIAQQLASGAADIRVTDVGWEWLDDGEHVFDPEDIFMFTCTGRFPTGGTKIIRYSARCEVFMVNPETQEETILASGVGSDELSVYVDEFTVTITAGRTELAAGAILSGPHETGLLIEVNPPLPWVQVDLFLAGGLGFEGEEGEGDSVVGWHGPARVDLGGGYWHLAGGPPVSGTTDDYGQFTAILTSSNKIDDYCAVIAQCGNQSDGTSTIYFRKGTTEFPAVDFFLGGTSEKTVTRLGVDDEPLDGHLILVHVASVTVAGQLIEPTPDEWRTDFEGSLNRLAPYAAPCIPYHQIATDGEGKARVSIWVADNDDIDALDSRCIDLSIHP